MFINDTNMSDNSDYKVLLVDDNKALGTSLQPQAERYGLDLQQCECWEDAQQELKKKFLEWDAIILDANCIYKKNESADMGFLPLALGELRELFGRHGSSIPWYVYTAGPGEKVEKEKFDSIMTIIKRYTRDDESWGNMLYYKVSTPDENGKDDVDHLFENIQRVASLKTRNKILFWYKEVFDAMEACLKCRKEILIEILTALHFPEYRKDLDPDKQYNRLRKVLEAIFYSSRELGLLPNDFFDKRHVKNLQDASRYMAGLRPNHIAVRYGEEGEYIFPPIIASTVRNILDVTNTGSHIEANQTNLLFGYALQLCDVIVWYRSYVENHSDRETNLAKCKRSDSQNADEVETRFPEYEGKSFLLEKDEEGNLHCDRCLVSYNQHQDKIEKKVRLHKIVENDKDTREVYPYFAKKVELVESE